MLPASADAATVERLLRISLHSRCKGKMAWCKPAVTSQKYPAINQFLSISPFLISVLSSPHRHIFKEQFHENIEVERLLQRPEAIPNEGETQTLQQFV